MTSLQRDADAFNYVMMQFWPNLTYDMDGDVIKIIRDIVVIGRDIF